MVHGAAPVATSQELAATNRELARAPAPRRVWIGTRDKAKAKGPFHVFQGGSPQKRGDVVYPSSLSVMGPDHSAAYSLPGDSSEAERRKRLAEWIVSSDNPLAPRVLVNRIWHYHFGTGIVSTPSDFGFMGGKPTHPGLLDYLAGQLVQDGWRIKGLHKSIVMSQTYRQSSEYREEAAQLDGRSRLLWRFPPRRLSAEEVRDTALQISGVWQRTGDVAEPAPAKSSASGTSGDVPDGGPGFRLYQYLQDNVSTYVPLDRHDASTYRRAIYHQNARASVVDLMTEFDLPDCAFSTPRRSRTTTPLQALTLLNHQFTLDMADALASRIESQADVSTDQVRLAFRLCYSRMPVTEEQEECVAFVTVHGLPALCRALLNTSELIYVK